MVRKVPSYRDHVVGNGVPHQLGYTVHLKLAHQPNSVGFYRAHAQVQLVGDLLVERALSNLCQHFPFSWCQGLHGWFGVVAPSALLQGTGDGRIVEGPAALTTAMAC